MCDVQGVYSERERRFSLIDPVIHSQESKTYGRTDRGPEGVKDFLRSHECNTVCRLMGLPHNTLLDPSYSRMLGCGGGSSSVPTSQYTVLKTNHLARRQEERLITTRELQAAVKHGVKVEQRGGRVLHQHNDIKYITDRLGRIGITAYPEQAF